MSPAGYTMFNGEQINLSWYCHMRTDGSQNSENLILCGEPKSQKWKYKVIRDEPTKRWLRSYIMDQSDRDEIMYYGSSNVNESIHNLYAVKANKRHDFRSGIQHY